MDDATEVKVALITGGSDGLGAAAATALAAKGYRIGVCARGEERLAEVVGSIESAGGEAVGVRADVTSVADLEHFVAVVAERWGRVDVVMNNAGTATAMAFDALSDEALSADLEQKLFGAVRMTRLALPHLRAAGGGSIINILSIGAKAPGKATMPTSISRAAGLAFTKALSRDLGPENIRVNAICIGNAESGQSRRRAETMGISEAEFLATSPNLPNIPLGRYGKPEEFGGLVAFLVSPEGAYLNGTAINFDGGMSPAT
jgi:NAD(P)-dependent dehydrogenase (short-subunit alcohol dehydrogenase family)